ncbi:MAG: sigma factor-like helix-turn-helix DNA-binding protein [Polyangiales bacterium]
MIEIGGEGEVRMIGAEEVAPGFDDPDRRSSRVRARTISIKRLSKRELERGRLMNPDVEAVRPQMRGECQHGAHAERPCPFVSCKHHLYLDVNDRTGSIKLNFPDLEVWDLPETCALDIADRGGITLEEVGEIMNLTRERIRQLETRGLAKLKALNEMSAMADFIED